MNENIIDYQNQNQNLIIHFTKDKLSYIKIEYLSETLLQYTNENYKHLFDKHPIERCNILQYNKKNNDWNNLEKDRWMKSYLSTPKHDKNIKKSYMFSGTNTNTNDNINDDLPNIFIPYYEHVKTIDSLYNQVVINWYLNGEDNIPYHSDCDAKMINDYKICIINLNETNDECRKLSFIKDENKADENCIINNLNIKLYNCMMITMYGNIQKYYKHGVIEDSNIKSSRISISLRQINIET